MEIVCESDYQDIYRITDGVLLVINKFRPMKIDGVKYPRMYGRIGVIQESMPMVVRKI